VHTVLVRFRLFNQKEIDVAKLNQIIAVADGQKGRTQKAITEVYHKLQKDALLTGISRKYLPKDDEGDQLPPEYKKVHFSVEDVLGDAESAMARLFDVVATLDMANCTAMADVVVGGVPIVKDCPVTTLLFLAKQLTDIHTLVESLPVLDPSEDWTYNAQSSCYATNAKETTRTVKVPRAFVKYEATKEHPAQVDVFTEDIVVGYWETIKFSGAIPQAQKTLWLEKVRDLQDAVKRAREEANCAEVRAVEIGAKILDAIFSSSGVRP